MSKPCVKCGSHDRYADGRCKPCTRTINKKWQAANPEKLANARAQWRQENPEKIAQISHNYRRTEAGREIRRINASQYRLRHSEKVLARKSLWRNSSSQKIKDYMAAWRAANPESDRIHKQNRRARKLESGGKLSKGLAERLFKLQRGKCACCGGPLGDDYHLDHIMPLALGGANEDRNMQLLRAKCNQQKHSKHPVDFMQQQRGCLL